MRQALGHTQTELGSELLETKESVKVAVVGILRQAGPAVTIYFADSCHDKNSEYREVLSSAEVVSALKGYLARHASHCLTVVTRTHTYSNVLLEAGLDMTRVECRYLGQFQAMRYAFACVSTVRTDGVSLCWHAPHQSKCGYLALNNQRSRRASEAMATIVSIAMDHEEA